LRVEHDGVGLGQGDRKFRNVLFVLADGEAPNGSFAVVGSVRAILAIERAFFLGRWRFEVGGGLRPGPADARVLVSFSR